MESCIHRVVRVEFILASSFDSTLRCMLPRIGRGSEETERDDAFHVFVSYMYTCIRARRCVYLYIYMHTCVAFAPVILNVREDISILVGKHTNSMAVYALSPASCTHILMLLHISTAIVQDLAERPQKNVVAMPSDKQNVLPEAFARHEYDFSERKENSTLSVYLYIRLIHPSIAKFRLDWISHLENNVRILLYLVLIHFSPAFVLGPKNSYLEYFHILWIVVKYYFT